VIGEDESNDSPIQPPPPDPETTISDLRSHFRRVQERWRADAAAETGDPGEWAAVISRIPPADRQWKLDTVVFVALGRLSNSHGRTPLSEEGLGKRGKRKAISGGSIRDTSMRQLVAMEEWIVLLQSRGHLVLETEPLGEEEGAAAPYTTPQIALRRRKIIQDPFINSLDAQFLRELGWVVLPSTSEACRTSSTGVSRQERLKNAAAHLTASALLFAPHAPHSLIRWLLAGHRVGGLAVPGVYVGNELDEVVEYREQSGSEDSIKELEEWMQARSTDTTPNVRKDKGDEVLSGIWVYTYKNSNILGTERVMDDDGEAKVTEEITE
jgi:hypothetical protein